MQDTGIDDSYELTRVLQYTNRSAVGVFWLGPKVIRRWSLFWSESLTIRI